MHIKDKQQYKEPGNSGGKYGWTAPVLNLVLPMLSKANEGKLKCNPVSCV